MLDATSGNTGIAYAMIGAALRLPRDAVRAGERDARAQAHPAARTAPSSSSPIRWKAPTARSRSAQAMYAASPERYFYPDQYNNPVNWRAHYDTTGPEILEQTGGRITHFVAGLGTSGTFMGTGRRLREFNPTIVLDLGAARLAAARPRRAEAHGDGHRARASTTRRWPTRTCGVGTEEAYEMTRRLAREEGLLVGISSGANLAGALAAWRARRATAVMVVIFCDGGEKYLSERFWDESRPEALRWRGAELMATASLRSARRRRRDSRARARDLSARMLRRAARARRRRCTRRVRAAEHDRGRAAAALPGAAGRLPRGREARAASRARAARLLPFASRSPGAAVAVRPRPRVAVLLVHHRLGPGGRRPRT